MKSAQFSRTPVLASPSPAATASPLPSTRTVGRDDVAPSTPVLARPLDLADAEPVRRTRTDVDGRLSEGCMVDHTVAPSVATPTTAETTAATVFALVQPIQASSTHKPATARPVNRTTIRRVVTAPRSHDTPTFPRQLPLRALQSAQLGEYRPTLQFITLTSDKLITDQSQNVGAQRPVPLRTNLHPASMSVIDAVHDYTDNDHLADAAQYDCQAYSPPTTTPLRSPVPRAPITRSGNDLTRQRYGQ